MFTGIITAVGQIAEVHNHGGDLRIRVTGGSLNLDRLSVGASIAVNGVCLTAVELDDHSFVADLSAETVKVTNLGVVEPGTAVNIEPSMRIGDSLDGHLVTGHIDAVGEVTSMNESGRALEVSITIPAGLRRYVARKGSVAVDGVSLTVNSVDDRGFAVAIIPHTRSATIIRQYQVGTAVNIEVDIIARYLERLTPDSQ